ncbi:glycosyltransferase family 2 protein [Geomobilimonas luticola]|uniref:Glycosyltransferase n=1 Tax=Geomobilimonas luticola TaxID=1114878 RepID=A0ABS5SEJ1_9BACT|nr:glycosyltransferase [Geomobilimonas luticola]
MTSSKSRVSIIVPVKPGGAVTALEGLSRIDYPADLLEIIVAEGSQPSAQRNRAAREARGDILYFLDDDSRTEPDFLNRAVCHYIDPAVAAVGGPSLTPDTDSLLQRSIGMALASPMGGGGMRNRYRRTGHARATGDHELILCNLSFRRELFLALGGLDERLYPNEENELMDRLRRRGSVLIHDPDLAVYRSQRPTFRAFMRQFLNYGRGRAEQTLISRSFRPVSFLPALMLLYLACVPFVPNPVYYLPLLWYAGVLFLAACLGSLQTREWKMFPLLMVVFPTIHLAYGAGLWRGFVGWPLKKPRPGEPAVTLRWVKEFAGGGGGRV